MRKRFKKGNDNNLSNNSFVESTNFEEVNLHSELDIDNPQSYIYVSKGDAIIAYAMDESGNTHLLQEFKILPKNLLWGIRKLCLFDKDTKLAFIDPSNKKILQVFDLVKRRVFPIYTNDKDLEDLNISEKISKKSKPLLSDHFRCLLLNLLMR